MPRVPCNFRATRHTDQHSGTFEKRWVLLEKTLIKERLFTSHGSFHSQNEARVNTGRITRLQQLTGPLVVCTAALIMLLRLCQRSAFSEDP